MSPRLSGVFSEINPQQLSHPTIAFLKSYWDEKRGARAMPARADIRPADLKQHGRWVVLVDALPGYADFRYRLVGTSITPIILGDATGKTVSEMFAPYGQEAVKGVLAAYRKAARDRTAFRSWGSASWIGQPHLDFDSIYLPLGDDGETANMVLGAAVFEPASIVKA